MFCDYNDKPCLSMSSIKFFKTNKTQHFFYFLLGLHRWPGQQFAIPEMFNFSNKSAHTIQHNIEYLNIPTTFFFLFVEINRKKVSFKDELLAGQVPNHMVIKCEVGRRMWGKGNSPHVTRFQVVSLKMWKWSCRLWGRSMKMKVRSQNVKVRFQVVMWLAASESEVQVVRS